MAKRKLELVVSNEPAEAEPPELPPQQQEMPFAVVNGEPVTELPKDLYIPPQALEVFLEAFEGPLDLLLYLIRRQNLDVLDIPIAEITRQYMKYIEVMTELQLELAGEYMVMAATLAEIKSRMLLPRAHTEGDGSEEDPRAELVRRLQEYERFKQAAENIDNLERLERDTWSASAELKDRKVVRLVPQITLQEMLLAFKDVVVRSEMFAHHHIQRERLSIRQRMSDIVSTLEHSSFVEFPRLFRPEEGRMGVTVTFVAILELVREGLIEIVQTEPYAPIHVRPAGAHRGLRLVANNERGEEEVAVDLPQADEGPTADELLLASTAPLDDDDDDFDDDDGPLEGVDDVVVEKPSGTVEAAVTQTGAEEAQLSEPVVAAVAEGAALEATLEAASEPALEAVGEPVLEVMSEPVLEVASESALEAVGEPVLEVASEPVLEVVSEPVLEVASELAFEAVSEPAFEGVNELALEAVNESALEVASELALEAVSEPALEATSDSVLAAVDESALEAVSELRLEAVDATPALEAASGSVVEAAGEPVIETVDTHTVADEAHEAVDELGASDDVNALNEPNETKDSGDVDEPDEFTDKPPAGDTTG